jgi:hypothetical protein
MLPGLFYLANAAREKAFLKMKASGLFSFVAKWHYKANTRVLQSQ